MPGPRSKVERKQVCNVNAVTHSVQDVVGALDDVPLDVEVGSGPVDDDRWLQLSC